MCIRDRTNTVDKREIEQFSSLSNKWWAKSGPFSALHKMSNARMEFIRQNASRILNKDKKQINLLDSDNNSLSVVDLAMPASTDVKNIKRQFERIKATNKKGMTVVFSTYQSIDVIAEAQKELMNTDSIKFTLRIFL